MADNFAMKSDCSDDESGKGSDKGIVMRVAKDFCI